MSDFNFNWLKENLSQDSIIFYIGAASLHEVKQLRSIFNNAKIYAFEPNNHWLNQYPIHQIITQYNIDYHPIAVSDIDGDVNFYPSVKLGDDSWPVSSSIFAPTNSLKMITFSDPVKVKSTRLDTFCEQNNVFPDFIHVDAQGAEYAIFSAMGSYKPKFIWTEVCEFNRYDTGVTYQQFYDLLVSIGYERILVGGPDELYALVGAKFTEYVPARKKSNIISKIAKPKVNIVFNKNDVLSDKQESFFYHGIKNLDLIGLESDEIKIPKETFVFGYTQYWTDPCYSYFGTNGFNERDPIPDNVVLRIREKTAFLIITMPFESPMDENNIGLIHNYIKKLELPSSQVIYLSGCLNGTEIYSDYCSRKNVEPVLNFEYNPVENMRLFSSKCKDVSSNYKFNKTKTFLMFNRRWHPHRTLFLYYLHRFDLMKDFYISFPKVQVDGGEVNFEDMLLLHYNRYDIHSSPIDNNTVAKINNNLPCVLDTDDQVSSSLMFTEFDSTRKFYEESFISIVAETYFFTHTYDILHLTEKTFKPIMYKHPFIMLGPPGMLKKLREMGFKTFHDVWDESYDETLDHKERFYKILDLCKKISEWPQIRKVLAMQKCKSIVDHNFNLLSNYNKNPTLLLDFIKRYKLSPYTE